MLKLFSSHSISDKNSQLDESKSFINFSLNLQLKIQEKLLIQILAWFLGGSIVIGGASHYFADDLLPSGINPDNQTELNRKS